MSTPQQRTLPGSSFKISVGDVALAADAYGDPGDPPVVLLHGGGQTRHSWGATAADLGSSGWHAVTVDLRGHGESGWSPDHGYGLDRFGEDVIRVADYVGRPPVLIGASLGGNAALAALGKRPALAAGLVLVDVSPFLQPAGTSRIRDFMTAQAAQGFGSLDEAADAIAAYLPHRPRPSTLDGLRKNLRQIDGRWFWHWDSARFIDLVPHAEFATVGGAHHMVAGDDNAIFEQVLADFLDRRIRSRLGLLEDWVARATPTTGSNPAWRQEDEHPQQFALKPMEWAGSGCDVSRYRSSRCRSAAGDRGRRYARSSCRGTSVQWSIFLGLLGLHIHAPIPSGSSAKLLRLGCLSIRLALFTGHL